jgi:hypothetical protein
MSVVSTIRRHQAEYKRLDERIHAMYVDKLDGLVDAAFFERISNQWREEQSTIFTYTGRGTFLRNHVDGIASIDMFVVPTISFRQSYRLLVLRHSRRELLWLGVIAHPSAEWIARQLTETCASVAVCSLSSF